MPLIPHVSTVSFSYEVLSSSAQLYHCICLPAHPQTGHPQPQTCSKVLLSAEYNPTCSALRTLNIWRHCLALHAYLLWCANSPHPSQPSLPCSDLASSALVPLHFLGIHSTYIWFYRSFLILQDCNKSHFRDSPFLYLLWVLNTCVLCHSHAMCSLRFLA